MTLFFTLRSTPEPLQSAPDRWLAAQRLPLVGARPLGAPPSLTPLQPIRQWLLGLEVSDRQQAQRLCALIPGQCPFERTVKWLGHTLFAVPPLCKLNPFYEELVALRFRALCYLEAACDDDSASV